MIHVLLPSPFAFLLWVVPLFAAAGSPVMETWLPRSADHWQAAAKNGTTLRLRNGSEKHVSGKVLDAVLSVKARLERASGVSAELALVQTDQPNAYATVRGGRPIIALSLSYLDRFGSDQDALAATIGHELAHLRLGHSAAARHADGAALSGANSVARHEEREADRLGMKWATAAGYDPCGQLRLFRAMSHDFPTESTHPGFAERVQTASAASKKITGRDCK